LPFAYKEEPKMTQRSLLAFFGLVFAITWGIAVLLLLFPGLLTEWFGPVSVSNPLFVLAVCAPTISALILTAPREGLVDLRRLLGRLQPWGIGIHWYLFVLLVIPALGYLAAYLAGVAPRPAWDRWHLFIPLLLSHLLQDPGPLGEELGWRGYALPRLLIGRSPLAASTILGGVWFVWHLPAFFISGTPQIGLSLPAFLLSAIALSMIATWLYLHSNGGVLLSVLLHLAANYALRIGAPMILFGGMLFIVAMLVVVAGGLKHVETSERAIPVPGL
jgi:membrane protease YdiL (CAAX protease family)